MQARPDNAAGLLFTIPALAWLFDAKGRPERAVELLALAQSHPACPHGWWANLHLLPGLEARIRAELPSDEHEAADARGRILDLARTVSGFSEELQSLTEPGG